MTVVKHTIAGSKDKLKGPLEDLLRKRSEDNGPTDTGLTLGEIIRALDLDKTCGPAVASTLIKIAADGNLLRTRGAATSLKGPRFVFRFRWKKRQDKKAATDTEDRRFLSFMR